jgi:hypothetical protein
MLRALLVLPLAAVTCGRSDPPTTFSTPPPPTTPTQPAPDGVMRPLADTLQRVPDSIAAIYLFSLSPDRHSLTIDPRPQPSRRAQRDMPGGFKTQESANGGKIITLAGGPFATGAWEQTTLRARISDIARLDELARAGYDLDQTRELLVVSGEQDPTLTTFAFSADASKLGLVGICHDVTLLDFGKPDPRPVAVRKPVVYLYPETPTRVQVHIDVDGGLDVAYPRPSDEGWIVDADPSGMLRDVATGRRHEYLFWESKSSDFAIDRARAHAVPGEESAAFLEKVCDRYALTDAECGDFVTYWLPELERNPHNVIELVDEARYGAYARLSVSPMPDTVIRLFMIFARSETPVAVGAPAIEQRTRTGFTVVEWGGADLDAAR